VRLPVTILTQGRSKEVMHKKLMIITNSDTYYDLWIRREVKIYEKGIINPGGICVAIQPHVFGLC